MGRPVQDAVDGHGDLVGGLPGDHAAGVAVAVVTREVAAGDLQPDPVAGQEDIRGDRQVQAELVRLAGGEVPCWRLIVMAAQSVSGHGRAITGL